MYKRTARAAVAIAVLLILAACGQTTTITPTEPPATAPTQAPSATAKPIATANPVPTEPAPPTAAPAATEQPGAGFTPELTVSPTRGGPGTVVTATGRRFGAGAPVVIRLGTPEPIGEALATAMPDAGGSFQVSLVIPAQLPSGEPIPDAPTRLYAMVERDQLNIGADFDFLPPAPQPAPASASDAVRLLLQAAQTDASLQQALPYLGGSLREEVAAGRADVGALLQIQNMFSSYGVDREYADGQGNVYVDARLFFGGDQASGFGRIFTLSNADGAWRVIKVTDAAVIPTPRPAWPGPGWQAAIEADLTGDGVAETVYYAPSSVVPRDRFGDANDAIAVVGSEVMVSQPSDGGDHAILLRAARQSLSAADKRIGSFVSGAAPDGPEAFLLAVTPGEPVQVHLLPLKADGSAYAQGVGVYWNGDEGAFRFATPDMYQR